MERLYEKYKPRTLADIVGQPPVHFLRQLAADPQPCCLLLEGPGGVGKTAAAFALAHDLGCHDEWTDRHVVVGCNFTVDACRDLWQGPLRLMARSESGFKVLVIEELEWLSGQTQVFLKDGLERNLPKRTIVIATSNGVGKLSKPLLQRFRRYQFAGCASFAKAARLRMAGIWRAEAPGHDMPTGWEQWGWDPSETPPTFSLRVALEEMADHLAVLQPVRAEVAGAV